MGHGDSHSKGTEDEIILTVLQGFEEATEGGAVDSPLGQNHEHDHSLKNALRSVLTKEGLKAWIQSFNLKKSFVGAYEFYRKNKDNPQMQEHLKNLVFIFPVSHAIEMTAGPLLTSYGVGQGWSPLVLGTVGVVGAIISVPGFDPLCILIYTAYPLKPVRRTITYTREKTFAVVSFAGKYSGLNYLLGKAWHTIDSRRKAKKKNCESHLDQI
jgi:hypothetical protein